MRAIDGDALGLTDMEIIMCNGNYKKALKMLLDKIDHAPTIAPERKTGKWIPCSERLPELDEDGYSDKVLVCFANFTGCEILRYASIETVMIAMGGTLETLTIIRKTLVFMLSHGCHCQNRIRKANRMKIEDKNKRKMFFASVNRTGQGEVRRMLPTRQSALDYGRNYKPYGGIYEQKHTDASVQE